MKIRTLITTAIAAFAIAAPIAQGQALDAAGGTATKAAASYYTPAALHALSARYQAMEAAYTRATPVASSHGNGFDWGYTALGAAAMLLIVGAFIGSIRLTKLTRNAQHALRTS